MTNDQMNDLKQFIVVTISQATADLVTKAEFKAGLQRLEDKVDSGFAGVGEAIEQIHQMMDERDAEVDRRLTKLEQQTA